MLGLCSKNVERETVSSTASTCGIDGVDARAKAGAQRAQPESVNYGVANWTTTDYTGLVSGSAFVSIFARQPD